MLRSLTDALGRTLQVPARPARIISLVPSHTETLFDLGAGDRVIGVTRYCVHPDGARSRKIVGGTKKIDPEVIDELQPDLIVAEQEENTREMIEDLERRHPVYVSAIRTVADALSTIETFGRLVGEPANAHRLVSTISLDIEQLRGRARGRVAYLIWRRPWMAAGGSTFIDAMLSWIGFENVFAGAASRYPAFTPEELAHLEPELVLFSTEPYPFKPEHLAELAPHAPGARLEILDGELLSWHGTRMLHLRAGLEQLLAHPH